MAFLNANNMCMFEGRLVADPELSYLPQNGGAQALAKCRIKIAVDRQMNKQQKDQAKQSGQPTADFIPVDIIGPRAEFVSNYFKKGSAIKAICSYKTFSYQKDGQTVYGQNFDAVDVGFTVGGNDSSGANGGNNNNGNNNNNAGQGNPGIDPNGFQAIDDEDLPF